MADGYFFEYEGAKIHYSRSGEGKSFLLCFHGFGQDHSVFTPITDQLKDKYTCYSFDIFYHGKSHWHDNHPPLEKAYWKKILAAFLKEKQIDSFSLLCFSMGGKLALTTVEVMPKRVDKLIMLAPDGIDTSMWYNLATYPVLFQRYFRSMIVRPGRFFGILRLFKSIGLVEKGISKFAASQMNSVKKRRRVYYSWVVFKSLAFSMKELAQVINSNNIRFIMILGRYDKIITEKGMSKLMNRLNDYHLEIIESGHNSLIKNVAEEKDILTQF